MYRGDHGLCRNVERYGYVSRSMAVLTLGASLWFLSVLLGVFLVIWVVKTSNARSHSTVEATKSEFYFSSGDRGKAVDCLLRSLTEPPPFGTSLRTMSSGDGTPLGNRLIGSVDIFAVVLQNCERSLKVIRDSTMDYGACWSHALDDLEFSLALYRTIERDGEAHGWDKLHYQLAQAEARILFQSSRANLIKLNKCEIARIAHSGNS